MSSRPTCDRLRELLAYDPESGIFTWKVSLRGKVRAGDRAGKVKSGAGRWWIGFGGHTYQAHRIAWCMFYGDWPAQSLDHINGDPTDNRIANLRLCTSSQNSQNRRARSTAAHGGLKGIYPRSGGQWSARIKQGGKTVHLGTYDTAQEAHAVYVEAAKRYFGEFARAA